MSSTSLTQPNLAQGVKWSIAAHVFLIVLILIQNLILPKKSTPYIPTLRVDLVGLPDILKKDMNEAKHTQQAQFQKEISQALEQAEKNAQRIQHAKPSSPQHVVLPSQSQEMVLKSKSSHPSIEKKNKRALERLKSLARMQEVSESIETHSAPEQIIKGNKISAGSSLSSDAKEAAEAHYYDLVQDRLQSNWTLPAWLARQDFSAQVKIFIDAQGQLKNIVFSKPSTNAQFNDAVRRTIRESMPFPVPPEALKGALLADGILVGFPL